MKIIGLCGQPASGKDTAADFFVEKGFLHLSTGDILREEMIKQGIPVDREHMGAFGAKTKKERGMGYLAELAADKIMVNSNASNGSNTKAVVSGLRAALEIDILRKRFGDEFTLLAIDAPIELRYERAKKRNRPGDDLTFEQFRAQEENERNHPSGAQEVDKVIALADKVINNSGTIEDLKDKLEQSIH
jgi:dephospho-CoA kinase